MNIKSLWESVSKFPLGSSLFNWLIRWKIPYTGSIHPKVLFIRHGSASVRMKDKRRVRNHLHSVHAIALMNLGEFTTGLAVLSAFPDNARSIITHLEIDFLKKARGTLTAISEFKEGLPEGAKEILEQKSFVAEASVLNEAKEVVAKVKAHWLVGPKPKVEKNAGK